MGCLHRLERGEKVLARESYEDLTKYVVYRTGDSKNRVGNILTEYSEVLKEAIKRGNTVKVEGLVTITFATPQGYVYQNRVYELDEQVNDVAMRLSLDSYKVRTVLLTYLKRIKHRLQDGYQVNIKGICYMVPTEVEEGVICKTRKSPVVKSPELADFILMTDNGLVFKELTERDLRIRVEPEEEIEFLYTVATEGEPVLSLREVNI